MCADAELLHDVHGRVEAAMELAHFEGSDGPAGRGGRIRAALDVVDLDGVSERGDLDSLDARL